MISPSPPDAVLWFSRMKKFSESRHRKLNVVNIHTLSQGRMLAEELNAESIDDQSVASRINGLLHSIEQRSDAGQRRITEEIAEAEDDSVPIYDALFAYSESEGSSGLNYEAVREALQRFSEMAEYAERRGLPNTAIVCFEQQVKIYEPLGGHKEEQADAVQALIEYLTDKTQEETVSHNRLCSAVEKVREHSKLAGEEGLTELAETLHSIAEQEHSNGRYGNERELLEHIRGIRQELELATDSVEDSIVNSVEATLELSEEKYIGETGDILHQSIDKYREFLPDKKANQWLEQLSESRRGIKNRFPKREIEVDMEPEEKLHNVRKDRFIQLRNEYDSSFALYSFLVSNPDIPDYESICESAGTITNLLPRKIYSQNDVVASYGPATDEDAAERRPVEYQQAIQLSTQRISHLLFELIDEGVIHENTLLTLYDTGLASPTSGNERTNEMAFLTDAVHDFFDERYSQSLHILVGRTESITRYVVEQLGESTTIVDGDTTRRRTLGGLFDVVGNHTSEDLKEYLKYQYSDGTGSDGVGFRHNVAHGRIEYDHANFGTTGLLLLDLLRVLILGNPTPYRAKYGLGILF